jgi:hypothetical protein
MLEKRLLVGSVAGVGRVGGLKRVAVSAQRTQLLVSAFRAFGFSDDPARYSGAVEPRIAIRS